MTNKARLTRLERATKPHSITWRQFVESGLLAEHLAQFAKDKDCDITRIIMQDESEQLSKVVRL